MQSERIELSSAVWKTASLPLTYDCSTVVRKGVEPFSLALQTSVMTAFTILPYIMECSRIELLFSGCKPEVFPLALTPLVYYINCK